MTWGGIAVSAALMWAAIFGFAYGRRQFGGSARGYALAAFGTWLATMLIFVGMAIFEQ